MSYHIKEILFRHDDFAKFSILNSERRLGKLSKINVFVGENNSGKSRFIRQLALVEKLTFVPRESTEELERARSECLSAIDDAFKRHRIASLGRIKEDLMKIDEFNALQEGSLYLEVLQGVTNYITTLNPNTVMQQLSYFDYAPNANDVVNTFQSIGANISKAIDKHLEHAPGRYQFVRVYVPTLRGLRNFGDGKDWYESRTKADYFSKSTNISIFTGLTLYEELKQLLLGDLDQRETVAEFQRFLGDAFFDKQPVVLIPKYNQDVLDVKIGEETQRPIYSLGDGIQALITLTFPIFQHKGENLLLFIEEPELFMHPGMQRVFMNVLLRPEFDSAQYFITTHSNHLLDLTLDIKNVSIFTFRKELKATQHREKDTHVVIENVSNEDERILQQLGIQNSSIFLSNCTIWVEGITDRRFLLYYLEVYQKRLVEVAMGSDRALPRLFKQDLHFSFVEYAGSNITHWSFLDESKKPIIVERLCGKLFLVTDKDAATGKKAERHVKLKAKLSERYYCLECREIENLLSPHVLSAVVESYEGEKVLMEKFTHDQYRDKPLGEFIEQELLRGRKKRKGAYKDESGTIADKSAFCERSLQEIKAWGDLSDEAQRLTTRIYDFILSQNA